MLMVPMKKILLVILGLIVAVNTTVAQKNDDMSQRSEPIETGEDYEVFGSEFPDDAQYFALGYLIRNSNVFEGQEVATRGNIKQVCQKKGCFFILTDGENEARVTFEDYDFFIPTNSAGKEVRLIGTFDVKELSEDKAKHYAEDADEDPDKVEGQQVEHQIEASTVKIFE